MLADRKVLILAAWLVSGLASGCKQREAESYQVQVMSIDAHGGPALSEDRVRAIVRRALVFAPSFGPAERDQRSRGRGDTLIASFEYRELPDASDHGRDLMVRLSVETPESLVAELGPEGLDVTVLLERKAGEADLAMDLQLASDRVATVLQARLDLARRTEGAIAQLLSSGNTDLVVLTLEWIREHANESLARESADLVAELIRHDEERVGLLAIETIGQIGGPEHVPALLDHIQLADAHQVSRAYDALALLGGPDAEGFLQFAARNEDEPDRRAAAQRALRRVADGGLARHEPAVHNRGHR